MTAFWLPINNKNKPHKLVKNKKMKILILKIKFGRIAEN